MKDEISLKELPKQEDTPLRNKYFDVFIEGIWMGSRRLTHAELFRLRLINIESSV